MIIEGQPALVLLIRMLFLAGIRRLRKTLGTPMGMIVAVLGGGGILLGIGPSLLFAMGSNKVAAFREISETVAEFTPFAFLSFAMFAIGSKMGRQFLELSPAELHFVLAGPFTDRAILTYRLLTFALAAVPATFLISIVAVPYGHTLIGVWSVSLLSFSFVTLLNLTLALLEARWPVPISVFRWGSLAAWVFVMLKTISPAIHSGNYPMPRELLRQFQESSVGHMLMWPFEPFGQLLRAENILQVTQSSVIPLLGSLILLALAYAFNIGFAELAAEGSDRRRTKMEKFQRGNVALGKQRSRELWSLPTFPWLGGVGPIAWSQLLMTCRKLGNILLFLFVLLVVATASYWVYGRTNWQIDDKLRDYVPVFAAVIASYLGFLVLITAQTGLSAPLPQLLWYKSLPIAPWRIVLGIQLGTAAYLWAARTTFAIAVYWISSQPFYVNFAFWLAGAMFDWVMVASVNTVAGNTRLRFANQGPPDILQGGRVMLLMLLNFMAVLAGTLPATILGAIGALFDPMLVTPLGIAAGLLFTIPFYCILTAWGVSRQELQTL